MKRMKIQNKKSNNKKYIYYFIKQEINDYKCEQQLIHSANYCPCELCDGFSPL
jgi:hypothetical protein